MLRFFLFVFGKREAREGFHAFIGLLIVLIIQELHFVKLLSMQEH